MLQKAWRKGIQKGYMKLPKWLGILRKTFWEMYLSVFKHPLLFLPDNILSTKRAQLFLRLLDSILVNYIIPCFVWISSWKVSLMHDTVSFICSCKSSCCHLTIQILIPWVILQNFKSMFRKISESTSSHASLWGFGLMWERAFEICATKIHQQCLLSFGSILSHCQEDDSVDCCLITFWNTRDFGKNELFLFLFAFG